MTDRPNSAKPQTAPRTRASKKRAAAEATARWRGMRQALGMPEAHVVDRAIGEALAFCMRGSFVLRTPGDRYVSTSRIFRVATLILTRGGADRDLAQLAVRTRLSPRESHHAPFNVPSTKMSDGNFTPPYRRGDLEWSKADLESMKKAAEPLEITTYDGVTRVLPQTEDHVVSQ